MASRGQKQTLININNHKAQDRIERYQNQKQLLQIINRQNAQISILHQVNTRMGQEMFRLQKKVGIDQDSILKELQQINQISVAFHIDAKQMEYLDSLLIAYDQNNMRQKKLIAHLYNSLEDSEKKAENLINDNQFLLGQLQGKSKQILQIYAKGFPQENLVSAYTKLQRQSQIQLIESIREQNQYLLRHYQQAQIQITKLNQQLTHSKTTSEQYFTNFKNQSNELSDVHVQLDDLIKIKQVLQKKLGQINQDNIELQTSRQQLQGKVSKLEGQLKLLRSKYQNQRKLAKQQIQRYSQQLQHNRCESQESEKRQRQLFNKNLSLQKQLQYAKDEHRNCKLQLQKNRSQFEQTLKMCEAYEQKMNNLNKKQLIMKETVQECKQRLDNTILDKQKAELKQKQLQKMLENIKQKNRQELETLKINHQKIISCQNQKIKFLEQEREDLQSTNYQNQCSLKHQLDKIKKQNTILKQQNQKHINNLRNHSGNQILSKIKDLQDKNQHLNHIITQKERTFHEDIDHKEEMIRNLQNQNRDLSRQVDRERNTAREATNERTQFKSRISILQKQKQCLQEELIKLKRNLDTRLSSQNDVKSGRIRELEDKLRESEKQNKQIKRKTMEMLQRYDEAEQQIKKEYQNRINQLTAQNSKLKHKLAKK